MRCVIYARVSSDRQRERHTIGSQLRELPRYARAQGWTVLSIEQDDGVSGETVEGRPAFQRVLDLAEDRAFDVLLVVDLDRISRSRSDAESAVIFDLFRRSGVKIATPQQGLIDLDNEDQDLQIGLLRAVAKFEKRKFLRRTARGKREAARAGKRYGCSDPYGYSYEGGAYRVVPSEAAIIRRIYSEAIKGRGANMIAFGLTSDGLLTRPRKRPGKPGQTPGPWAVSTVKKLLKSTTYRGDFRTFKKDSEGGITIAVPAIVTAATWERAQAALTERRTEGRWQGEREYLLSGMVRCGVCDSYCWVVRPKPNNPKSVAYYRCASTNAWRKMRMDGPCGLKHFRQDVTDARVWTEVVSHLSSPSLLAQAASSRAPKGVDWSAQAAGARRALDDLTRHESAVLARLRRKLLSSDACDAELAQIARERKIAQRNFDVATKQLAQANASQEARRALVARAEELRTRAANASFADRRDLLRALRASVTLQADGSYRLDAQILAATDAAPVALAVTGRALRVAR